MIFLAFYCHSINLYKEARGNYAAVLSNKRTLSRRESCQTSRTWRSTSCVSAVSAGCLRCLFLATTGAFWIVLSFGEDAEVF